MCNFVKSNGETCKLSPKKERCGKHINKIVENNVEVKVCKKATLKTYCGGPVGLLTRPITYNDFAEICKTIQKLFKETLNKDYIVQPERITEGGIEFIKIDQPDTDKAYKSMRFHARQCYYQRVNYYDYQYEFPRILTDDCFEPFAGVQTILFGNKAHTNKKYLGGFETFLKAFYEDSDPWTVDELTVIKSVFRDYGCEFVKMPKDRDLIQNY